jgi:hypothetical protein
MQVLCIFRMNGVIGIIRIIRIIGTIEAEG